MKDEIVQQINTILASMNMVFVCGYENCGHMTSSIERLARLRDFLLKNCEIVPCEDGSKDA